MEFIVIAMDREDGGVARQKARAAHLRFITGHPEAFVYGGPMLSDDGKAVRGSLMVLRFDDRAALDRHMALDPYFNSDMFSSVQVWPSRQVIPERVPGQLQAELDRQLALDAQAAG